ncbi:hypothetical protein ZWY2020_042766 [Hordeum vulgare]|nr:hypothetical protein ZWY2020_042766 [Hordeum vulgare]
MPATTASARPVAVLRCIVAALVVTVLLAGLVVLVFWLVVRPKPIEYSVARAAVRHLNLTAPPGGGGGATLNASFYLTLAADNPNRRVSMRYSSVVVYVHYGAGEVAPQLAVADVPDFRQPSRNETRLEVRAVARSAPVADWVARELEHDRPTARWAWRQRDRGRPFPGRRRQVQTLQHAGGLLPGGHRLVAVVGKIIPGRAVRRCNFVRQTCACMACV